MFFFSVWANVSYDVEEQQEWWAHEMLKRQCHSISIRLGNRTDAT